MAGWPHGVAGLWGEGKDWGRHENKAESPGVTAVTAPPSHGPPCQFTTPRGLRPPDQRGRDFSHWVLELSCAVAALVSLSIRLSVFSTG